MICARIDDFKNFISLSQSAKDYLCVCVLMLLSLVAQIIWKKQNPSSNLLSRQKNIVESLKLAKAQWASLYDWLQYGIYSVVQNKLHNF